jgi:hypothetical protein
MKELILDKDSFLKQATVFLLCTCRLSFITLLVKNTELMQ